MVQGVPKLGVEKITPRGVLIAVAFGLAMLLAATVLSRLLT
jgi:small-conductance mechanosensitive channel